MSNHKVLIIGGGAVGRSLACLISKNNECTLITKSDCSSPHTLIREEKREVASFKITNFLPTDSSQYSVVLVASKAYQLSEIYKLLLSWSSKYHSIIFLQNGLGIYQESLNQKITCKNIYRGILYYGSYISSPSETKLFGVPKITIAPEDALELKELFIASEFQVTTKSDANEIEWTKALVSLSLVLVAAHRRETNDIVLRDAEAKSECLELLSETRLIAASEGYDLSMIKDEALIESVKNYGKNRNALLVDIENGRETELPWTLDKAIECASRHNIEVPKLLKFQKLFRAI